MVELVCVIFPFIVIIGLFWRTVVVEDDVNHLSKNPDVLVQVTAFKWNWQFSYEQVKDASGQEVEQAYAGNIPDYVSDKKGQPLYLSTVGSSDEIPILVIPVGKSVQIIEHSQDVIHSFWVPEFLFKRDVIPYGTDAEQDESGLRDNRFEFTATQTGSYVGRCAELCGTYHSQMNFEVRVVTPRAVHGLPRRAEADRPGRPGPPGEGAARRRRSRAAATRRRPSRSTPSRTADSATSGG